MIFLDTHAALWFLMDDERLGHQARESLSNAEPLQLLMSDISLLEISLLISKGRVQISGSVSDLLHHISNQIRIVPIDSDIAAQAMDLDLPGADPFDRIIAASALKYHAELVTRDRRLVSSTSVNTLW